MARIAAPLARLALVSAVLAAHAEAGGIKLKKIRFPESLDGISGEAGPTAPAGAVPLSQAIVFEFDGKPKMKPGVASALRITAVPADPLALDVPPAALGTFVADGKRIVFRPRLPTAPLPADLEGLDPASDLALPGLKPATTYRIEVALGTPDSIANLKGVASGLALPIEFTTVAFDPQAPDAAFGAAPAPKLVPKATQPAPGTTGIDPNLFSDPAGLFSALSTAKHLPFVLHFKAPLDPSADNLSAANFVLRSVKAADGAPLALSLPCEPVLVGNAADGAEVQVFPLGPLPFGHTLELGIAGTLRSLSGATGAPQIVGQYGVAKDPQPGAPIADALREEFADAAHQDAAGPAAESKSVAAWDVGGSGGLRATFGFGGDGSLGAFDPPAVLQTIWLDTDAQPMPLYSGATPGAEVGTVTGGVFHFTTFHLPPQVTLRTRGSHPLVITCLGDCVIEGLIDVSGEAGTDDVTFDSAIHGVPGGAGGPGGGRGGMSHPVLQAADGQFKHLVPSPFGESGFGPGDVPGGGGGGGQNGCTLPWTPFAVDPSCSNSAATGDGSRGGGGGGGSFNVFFPAPPANPSDLAEDPSVAVSGRRGAIGIGNHVALLFDAAEPFPAVPAVYEGEPNAVAKANPGPTFAEAYAQGMIYDKAPYFTTTTPWATSERVLLGGAPGPAAFVDGDPANDFIGAAGEVKELRGGQGGGGGGSRMEGLDAACKPLLFDQLGLPIGILDARGGSGGGGGGALRIRSLTRIVMQGNTAQIRARGGVAGAGEEIGVSDRGGSGGGGSGGCVVLEAGQAVDLGLATSFKVIDVSPGCTPDAAQLYTIANAGTPGAEVRVLQVGDGGPGGPGLIVVNAPSVTLLDPAQYAAEVNVSVLNIGCGIGISDGLEPVTVMKVIEEIPRALSSASYGRSTWYDLGVATVQFRPPVPTSAGPIEGPIFGVPGEGPFFHGTDASTGLVLTDAAGNVLTPFANDFEVHVIDTAQSNFIPQGPQWFEQVAIRFQGADASAGDPGLPDLATATAWVTDPTLCNGKRFVRFEVVFDIATDPAVVATPATPRPQLNFLQLPYKY